MYCFAGISSKLIKFGTLQECFDWGRDLIECKKARFIKIVKCRPNEPKARIVFELSHEGVKRTPHGRVVNLSLLRKDDKYGKT